MSFENSSEPKSSSLKLAALLTLAASFAVACGDSKSAGSAAEPAYALQTTVYQPDDSAMSYVAFAETLDLRGQVEFDRAAEFPGYAFISVIGGRLLVSSGEAPEITQYEVGADHALTQRGRVSFGSYGVPAYGAGFERHWFLNEHTAYLTHEVTSRIVWDPMAMKILGVKEDTQIPAEVDGLALDATFNRPPLFHAGPVLKPFYYRDENWYLFGPNTPIAVYDTATHLETKILDVDCPALEVMSQDEAGNTYFSPWTYGPALSLFGEGPRTCIRRVKPDSTVDDDWTPDLSQWTDGRPVQVLRYVADGKALGTVLHLDEVEGDFSTGYDEDLALELDSHWRLWEFDLVSESARLIDEIPSIGSGFNMTRIDGRTFVFVPDAEWTSTTVFELETSGKVSERFSVPGILNNWVKLR